LLTLTEMATRAARLSDAVSIPIIADADNGYGNAVNVARTVREYERAGVACIQIEDQVAPKKCGHMLGRDIISAGEMAGKIKAACDALTSSGDLVGLKSGHLYIWALPEHVDQVAAQIRSAMASRQTEDIPRLIRSIASNAAKRDFAWAVFDEMYAGCSIPMEA